MDLQKVLFALLKASVSDKMLTEETKKACTEDVLEQVFVLAQKHDLAHLLGCLDLPDSALAQKLKKAPQFAAFRYVQLNYEFERICKTLDNGRIPYIPLKKRRYVAPFPQQNNR